MTSTPAENATRREQRRTPRPPDDPLTKRLQALKLEVLHDIRSLETHISQVEGTNVAVYTQLQADVADLRTTMTNGIGAIQAQIAAHAAVIEEQKRKAEEEKAAALQAAAEKHDQAVWDRAQAELLAKQQVDKDKAAVALRKRLNKHNRIILLVMAADVTAVFALGTYLFENADHSTPTNSALAISGIVLFITLLLGLAIRIDPDAGL